MKYTLGFIGCGNMGGALVTAAAKSVQADKIAVCDHNAHKVSAQESALGVVVADGKEIAKHSRFVVLGVKPQAMQSAIAEIAEELCAREDVVMVTMAAGLSIQAIRGYIGKALPVIRIMPNTPVLVGAGMSLYATDGVDEATETEFLRW